MLKVTSGIKNNPPGGNMETLGGQNDVLNVKTFGIYRRTLFIWIKWDSDLSRYAENPDNWIFLSK
jgi:hypothetical protein